MSEPLPLATPLPVRFASGGHFVSRGQGRHPTRRIDSHELIVVEHGQLALFEDASSFRLGRHDFLHLRPGRRHGASEDYDSDTAFYWLHFHHRRPSRSDAVLPQHGALVRPEAAIDAIRRLLDAQDRGGNPPGLLDLLLQVLLLECTRAPAQAGDADPSGLAERARAYIVLHHAEPIGSSEVAAHCGCHPDHLGRLFRARFGRTLTSAIHDERLRQARSRLRDSDLPIAAIAVACGYAEAHYFRRCFKRATGLSPAAWRQLHQRQRINTE